MNSSHYGSVIKAFSSRKDYCQEALDLYRKMLDKNVQPDEVVFQYTLYACSKLGNVKFAFDVLSQMKVLEFPMKSVHLFGVLKTYATAVSTHFIPESLVKLYVQDGWDLLNKALVLDSREAAVGDVAETRLVTAQVLNSFLELHVNALQLKDAEELVLPLFDQLNLKFDDQTYEVTGPVTADLGGRVQEEEPNREDQVPV